MELKDFDPNGGSADDVTQTNGMRADRAANVFQRYESDYQGTERLTDLLADLQHLAHREGWDFERALTSARMHFDAEAKWPDADDLIRDSLGRSEE
jgi:hypothetical protein